MNRFLLSVVAVFWVTASAWAAPAVVQSKTYAGASSDTCTFTLDSTPTSGNMMVAFMAADNDRYLKLSGGPDTWTEIQTGSNGGTVTGRAAWRRIGSESTSQSIWVTDSGNTGHYTSTYVSCIILEISGDVGDGTAIDNSNVTTPGSFGTSITGTSLTPPPTHRR